MKTAYRVLKIVLWSVVTFFVGTSSYRCYDYYVHPGLYAATSAPWYLSIQINAVFTVIIAASLLMVMWFIKRKNN